MAVYKVPQDVEAEDKLVGPFTFRQFIFLIVAAISLFVTVQLFRINPVLSVLTLPILVVFSVLGLYRRPDQPVEIYLLAVLRFYLKPHRRIWDQEGTIDSVRITAPKKITRQYTDGLSQNEVQSRLSSLAQVMDSRGWSVKNVDINSPLGTAPIIESDRLIMPNLQAEPTEIHASDDMLDVFNNAAAREVDQRMQQTSIQARQDAVLRMQQAQAATLPPSNDQGDDGNVSYNPYPSSMRQHVIAPISGDDASGSGARNQARSPQTAQLGMAPGPGTPPTATSPMTQPPSDAILRLANNSDLRVSTIASEAARIEALEDDQTIQLH